MVKLPNDIKQTVEMALAEDIGDGDITARLISSTSHSIAQVICRDEATVCGAAWFDEVYRQLDPNITVIWKVKEGDRVGPNQVMCTVSGPSRPLMSGERTALNFLQTLSGTASLASAYAKAVLGTSAKVLDTRKTIPGLRSAQKYAVVCGGCFNHRMGLYDGILIKENHILASDSIKDAVLKAQKINPDGLIEIEVETIQELKEALNAGAKRLLLDNMTIDLIHKAVKINAGRAKLEASGGISLKNIHSIANTDIDYISVGDLTKDVKAVDFSMRLRVENID
jgi:nicotinate-nucleotide pyrophosphorylase (carboxylating)